MIKGISIITPHYNCLDGLLHLESCLQSQTSGLWEWIIVDDCSDLRVQEEAQKHFNNQEKITFYTNLEKSNASKCRNIGVSNASYDFIVFLDSDDSISPKFLENRLAVSDLDFTVFQRFITTNGKDEKIILPKDSHWKKQFLQCNFIWQTTCVVWKKSFFIKLNGFDENFPILQDVELQIRALYHSTSYVVFTDNEIDFTYKVSKIDVQKRTLNKVSLATNKLIDSLINNYNPPLNEKKWLRNFYFLNVRYFVLSELSKENELILRQTLKNFQNNQVFNSFDYTIGSALISLVSNKIVSKSVFLNLNRKLYKSN